MKTSTLLVGIVGIFLLFVGLPSIVTSMRNCSSSNATQYQCPNPKDCPESGYSFVSSCSDCQGHSSESFSQKQCFHRKLLSPNGNPSRTYFYRDWIGILVWFVASGVATACGVGGGGIYVPLGILLLAFAPKSSSGLSQASIFGASVGGLVLNLRNKHPFTYVVKRDGSPTNGQASHQYDTMDREIETISSVPTTDETPQGTEMCQYYTRPIIDYDMAMFLAPMEMAGSVLGVLIQAVLPNWLYLVISCGILGFTSYKTYIKWWDTRTKEKKATEGKYQRPNVGAAAAFDTQQQPLIQPDTDYRSVKLSERSPEVAMLELHHRYHSHQQDDKYDNSDEEQPYEDSNTTAGSVVEEDIVHEIGVTDAEKIARRNVLLELDARQYPAEKLVVFFVLWVGMTLLTFLKGGKGVDSLIGITCEEPWYWDLIAIQFFWTLGFVAYFGWRLLKDTKEKQSVGYPFHPDDVLWDFPNIRFYGFYTFVAGIVAGLIGVGGGMVLGPLMLVMGIHPSVSTATTATMIVLTSSSVAVLFVISGLVPWEYAACFFVTCFFGALVGKIYIDGYVKKTGKASILIFLLATIIAFATIGTLVIVLIRLTDTDRCLAWFHQYCNISLKEKKVACASPSARLLADSFYVDVVSMIHQHDIITL
ncbi:sulfite exporter TauE/SafE [Nitzschia inconspicua]|uniref:Sulfite exporter TauE/SafE n=1 Tax=Nitzschia inconspicua TaxID=303405 RepID=A0A9K3Q1T1_9STRA|nr:sulfite exporter TauE/SafE [Nitzschia inconspicua]